MAEIPPGESVEQDVGQHQQENESFQGLNPPSANA
jgi:hypothetical protein